MKEKRCLNCGGKLIHAKRSTKKYCDNACKLQYHRRKPTKQSNHLMSDAMVAIRGLSWIEATGSNFSEVENARKHLYTLLDKLDNLDIG